MLRAYWTHCVTFALFRCALAALSWGLLQPGGLALALDPVIATPQAQAHVSYYGHKQVQEGDDFVIHCFVRKGTRISWTKDGWPLQSLSQSGTYTVSQYTQGLQVSRLQVWNAEAYHAGVYSCSDRSPASHVLEVSPKSASRPEPAPCHNLVPNETQQLHCSLAGTKDVAWYKDGEPLILDDDRFLATGATLEIKRATEKDVGAYGCGDSHLGQQTIVTHVLRLVTPIFIEPIPGIVRVHPGEPVRLVCQARSVPEPRVSWFSGKNHQTSGAVLSIKRAASSDTGAYTCKATHGRCEQFVAERPVRVNVFESTIRTNEPYQGNGMTLIPGSESLLLQCDYPSNRDLKIYWFMGDKRLAIQPSEKYNIDRNGRLLTIKRPSEGDVSNYTCIAFDSFVNESAVIVVGLSVKIRTEHTKTFVENNAGYLHCAVEGVPKPIVRWYRNNKEMHIRGSKRLYYKSMSGAFGDTIVLQKLQTKDSATFTCVADNGHSQDRKVIRVSVKGKYAAILPFICICIESALLVAFVYMCQIVKKRENQRSAARALKSEERAQSRPETLDHKRRKEEEFTVDELNQFIGLVGSTEVPCADVTEDESTRKKPEARSLDDEPIGTTKVTRQFSEPRALQEPDDSRSYSKKKSPQFLDDYKRTDANALARAKETAPSIPDFFKETTSKTLLHPGVVEPLAEIEAGVDTAIVIPFEREELLSPHPETKITKQGIYDAGMAGTARKSSSDKHASLTLSKKAKWEEGKTWPVFEAEKKSSEQDYSKRSPSCPDLTPIAPDLCPEEFSEADAKYMPPFRAQKSDVPEPAVLSFTSFPAAEKGGRSTRSSIGGRSSGELARKATVEKPEKMKTLDESVPDASGTGLERRGKHVGIKSLSKDSSKESLGVLGGDIDLDDEMAGEDVDFKAGSFAHGRFGSEQEFGEQFLSLSDNKSVGHKQIPVPLALDKGPEPASRMQSEEAKIEKSVCLVESPAMPPPATEARGAALNAFGEQLQSTSDKEPIGHGSSHPLLALDKETKPASHMYCLEDIVEETAFAAAFSKPPSAIERREPTGASQKTEFDHDVTLLVFKEPQVIPSESRPIEVQDKVTASHSLAKPAQPDSAERGDTIKPIAEETSGVEIEEGQRQIMVGDDFNTNGIAARNPMQFLPTVVPDKIVPDSASETAATGPDSTTTIDRSTDKSSEAVSLTTESSPSESVTDVTAAAPEPTVLATKSRDVANSGLLDASARVKAKPYFLSLPPFEFLVPRDTDDAKAKRHMQVHFGGGCSPKKRRWFEPPHGRRRDEDLDREASSTRSSTSTTKSKSASSDEDVDTLSATQTF